MSNPAFALIFCMFQGISIFLNGQNIGPKDRYEQAKYTLHGHSELKNASFSWCFRDAATRQIVDSFHTELRLVPASTAKLTATIASLELLGPDYKYQTQVYIRGEIMRNQLHGDLIVVGSGDPSFGSGIAGSASADSILSKIYLALQKIQVKKIKGSIIIDPQVLPYNHLSIPGSWQWEDMGNYYGAGIYGVNWRSNSFSIQVVRGTKQSEKIEIERISPKLYDVEFINLVKSNESNPDEDLYIYSAPMGKTVFVDGNIHQQTKS